MNTPMFPIHTTHRWTLNRTNLSALLLLAAGCAGQVEPGSPSGAVSALDECTMGDVEECTQRNQDVGERTCTVGTDGYVWSACAPAKCEGKEIGCATPDGQAGVAQCAGGLTVSACGLGGECTPGETTPGQGQFGCAVQCSLVNGMWQWEAPACGTPLVLSFDRQHVEFTEAGGEFDLVGQDLSVGTRWVSSRTPWLAIDLDGNGRIDDGRELFGSMTVLPDGRIAPNGFAALAALDEDHDGELTERDPAFDRLLVWSDTNQDRRSDPSELQRARDVGLVSIHLGYASSPVCIEGDCEVERATFEYADASGQRVRGDVIDVHLATR
jgi:hypothetical protein